VLEETTDAGGLVARYSLEGGSYFAPWVATYLGGLGARFPPHGRRASPLMDGVGTTRRLVTSGNTAWDKYELDAFGADRGSTSLAAKPMRAKNIRRTMTVLWNAGVPASCLLFAYLAVAVHPVFAPLLLSWVFLLARLVKRTPCPNCGRPIGWSRYKFLGTDAESGVPPRFCAHCGYDLTGKGGEPTQSGRS